MVAHMYEPFLPDDSAGSAVICEICRSLKSLIDQGKLPPLKKRPNASFRSTGLHPMLSSRENWNS